MKGVEDLLERAHIAYFSMEIALRPEIPTYSGGLGVLAGDTLRSAADLGLPLIGVTNVSRAGYMRQEIDADGRQLDFTDPWEPSEWATVLGAKITVELEGRSVWVRPWLYLIEGGGGHRVPVILLDTDLPENLAEDREITHYLYGGDHTYRLKQEAVLSIGGVRLLHALGLDIRAYHMNEGHSALLGIELAHRCRREAGDSRGTGSSFHEDQVRRQCIFTTHTPVAAGHDKFGYDVVERVLGATSDINDLKLLSGPDRLNMTCLALNLSGYINGVAKRHAEVSNDMFPGYCVHAITNGVHPETWTCPSFARLYDKHVPTWRHEPELLVRADQVPDEALWQAHQEAKQVLLDRVAALTGTVMELDLPVLGFARRVTSYKRPELLFADLDALVALHGTHPFQIVLAGNAHPSDTEGKRLIEQMHKHIRRLAGTVKVAFVPDYNMELAGYLTSGCDVWLNTPLPPMEASGTSGMKAAFNGVPNLGILDGWWIEGCIEGVTGWAIGGPASTEPRDGDARALYDKLGSAVLPLYHTDRQGWIAIMKGAIGKNAYYFNTHRMMRRYATDAYNRCR